MVAEHVGGEVVAHEAAAGRARAGDRRAAVEQVVMPEQHIASAGGELLARDSGFGDQLPHPLDVGWALVGDHQRRWVCQRQVLAHHVGKPVASGHVEDRAAALVDVLERDPGPDEEARRLGHHVEGVGVGLLLAALDEVVVICWIIAGLYVYICSRFRTEWETRLNNVSLLSIQLS